MQLLNHCDLDRLYLKTLGAGHKRIAITACDEKSGVSTMAMALAQRHLLAGASVLYVELNSFAPAMTALCDIGIDLENLESPETQATTETHQKSLKAAAQTHHLFTPMLVTSSIGDDVVTGVLAPQEQNHILALRNPTTLAKQLDQLGKGFDAIVIDCAPLCSATVENHANQGVPADLVATVADATVVMIQAGVTKAPHLKRSMQLLQQQNVTPAAMVMNNQHNPSLGQELIRQAKRLERCLPKLSGWIQQKINNSLLMLPL